MQEELNNKIDKYKRAAAAASTDVEKSQYLQLVKELEARIPKAPVKLHIAEEAVCESCQ
jgi:hypothetical protein